MKRKAADIASFFGKSSKKQPSDSKTQENNRQDEREKEQTDPESEGEEFPENTSPGEMLGIPPLTHLTTLLVLYVLIQAI